jgi:hypothetical protein
MIGMALAPDIVGCQRQHTDCASHPIIGNGGEELQRSGYDPNYVIRQQWTELRKKGSAPKSRC